MADPHHIEELDGFDRMTVFLYRLGLGTAALGVCALGAGALVGSTLPGRLAVLVGVLMAVWNMHLYDRRIRWVLQGAGPLGAALWVVGAVQGWSLVEDAAMGVLFVALSGFALKEQFCFKIPLLRAVPLFLALGLIPLVAGIGWATAILYGIPGIVLCSLVFQKARMPLHFDIGNKAYYQV